MKPIYFKIHCDPPRSTAQQQKRLGVIGGKARMFTSPKGKTLAAEWNALLSPHAPDAPLEGCLTLIIEFTWPHLKAAKKSEKVRRNIYHGKKPDCSNIVKQIEDTMTDLDFWHDDGQIAKLTVIKQRGLDPGVRIYAKPIQETL